jgi:hypothetical protein
MASLPQQIRPIAIPVSAAQPHSSSNNAPVAEKSNEMVYEGYTFFKADPINGTKATWIHVERTRICLPQNEISIKVQKTAHRKSAAQQYQELSDTRQGHIDQLIHERQKGDPSVEWMCVYVKERERPTNRDNPFHTAYDKSHERPTENCGNFFDNDIDRSYETVSMDVIIMRRPAKIKAYPKTRKSGFSHAEIAYSFNRIEIESLSTSPASWTKRPVMKSHHASVLSQNFGQGYGVEGDLPREQNIQLPFSPENHSRNHLLELGDTFDTEVSILYGDPSWAAQYETDSENI